MDTNINPTAVGAVLILMAAASLFIMLSLNQINYIVHGDLYLFGLQFSNRWAMPYWVISGLVFGLSWTNISLSAAVALYFFRKSRKKGFAQTNASIEAQTEEMTQPDEAKEKGSETAQVESENTRITHES